MQSRAATHWAARPRRQSYIGQKKHEFPEEDYPMAKVSALQTVNATIPEVWLSWDQFGTIDAFNPNLKRSFLLDGSAATGLGATRQCDFKDGKNYIRERIIEYRPEEMMKVDIYDGTVPLKSATAQINLAAKGVGQTEVTFTIDFKPKFGLLGKFLVPLMKPQFKKDITSLLKKNADFIEARTP